MTIPDKKHAFARDSQRQRKIKAQQTAFIHELALSSQAGGVVLSALLLFTLWGSIDALVLLGWFIVLNILSTFRFISWRAVRDKLEEDEVLLDWLPRLQILLFLSGCMWGLGGWMFIQPEAVVQNSIVVLFLAGVISGSLGALSPNFATYILYAMPVGVPTVLKLFTSSESFHVSISFALFLFLIINVAYASNFRDTILKIILLRFENDRLVKQLKSSNEQANQQAKIAEAANLSKSKFMAAASHDLAQPLHSLTLFLSAMSEEKKLPNQQDYLEKAQQSAAALNKLFSELMDMSKLEAGEIVPTMESFYSLDLIHPIAEEFELKIQHQDQNLEVDVSNHAIKTDGIIFQRILRNLLSNAVKHNKEGTIGIRTERLQDQLQVEVFDTGDGIPESELGNIFKEYFQLNNPERDREKGLGLGLTNVQKLLKLIESQIEVDSKIGEGTSFYFKVPLSKEDPPTRQAQAQTISKLDGGLIVFIDDDKSIRDGMRAQFHLWNANCIVADSEQDAISKLVAENLTPTVIVSDYRLRDKKTGLDAIATIREEFNLEVPAIIISGDTSKDLLDQMNGLDISLAYKPLDPKELERLIIASIKS